ncbi:lamin tail domain-containing protein [bacterium]|nr:lamin tail domain-containing protein [bacterium]
MSSRPARIALLLATGLLAASLPVHAADHLLISEFAVTPTDAEFFEIYNPTSGIVDLTNYYVSDFVFSGDATQNYWRLPDGALVPDGGFANDFCAKFPDGAVIAPGQSLVICLHDNLAFTDIWGPDAEADYEMIQDGVADGVPGMVDPGPALVGVPLIQADAGLSNAREVIVLFHWDGQTDLVQDVDIVQWSDSGPNFSTVSPNKTGVPVDGPDADALTSTYLPDTAPQGQDLASPGQHAFGRTVSRIDFTEGAEALTNGNGLTGHNETSENYSATWLTDTRHSIGSPGDYGPPALLSARADALDRIALVFSRDLDAVSAASRTNYSVLQVLTSGGDITELPVQVLSAVLDTDGRTVLLETSPLKERALYRVSIHGVLSDDLSDEVVQGTQVLVYGYNARTQLVLDVPPAPFVPHLDQEIEIRYTAPQGEHVLLRVFDVEGRDLFAMVDETAPPGGLRSIRWDGRDHLRQRLPAGLYTLHLSMPGRGEETVAPVVIGASSEGAIR